MKEIKSNCLNEVKNVIKKITKKIKTNETVKNVEKEITEQEIKNNSEAITNMERARIIMDSSERDKMDGRMVASWGENVANKQQRVHYYPEDKAKIEELLAKGDFLEASKLQDELKKQGKCYYS